MALANRENRTVSDFKSSLLGGGARPNLFEVVFTESSMAGNAPWSAENFKFMCKASSLPASNIANIDVPFRGRIFKVAGDRTIENWSITVINDENFAIRNAFEEWMQVISRLENNLGATNPDSYMRTAHVIQLGKGQSGSKTPQQKGSQSSGTNTAGYGNDADGKVVELAKYEFQDIWPTNISAIDLSYDNSDQIEEFTVEFCVQSYSRLNSDG